MANERHGGAEANVDAWFGAWSEPDAATREAPLERIASHEVRFLDRFSLVEGLGDLRPHLAAVHRFMPGMKIRRQGAARHCQGTLLSDWVALGADGRQAGTGTNVFELGPGGLIHGVTGLWNQA